MVILVGRESQVADFCASFFEASLIHVLTMHFFINFQHFIFYFLFLILFLSLI